MNTEETKDDEIILDEDTTIDIDEVLNQFDDEDDYMDEEETDEAKRKFFDFKRFLHSEEFREDIEEMAREHGVPPRKIAKHFLTRCFATVSDILGIAFSYTGATFQGVIDLIHELLSRGCKIVFGLLDGLSRIIGLNRTNNPELVGR